MDLIALTLNSANLYDKKVSKLISYIIKQMSDEENGGEPQKILEMCQTLNKEGVKAFGDGAILYLLVEKNQVLSTALASAYSQISFRWTPPKHRKKGYATKILQMIGDKWRITKIAPLWVCSYPRMENINKNAGWVNDGITNRDDTQDWFPDWCADRYIKRRNEHHEAGTSHLDEMAELIKPGSGIRLATEEEDADIALYMTQFPQIVNRKKAQMVKV
jgi:hypothetical protein